MSELVVGEHHAVANEAVFPNFYEFTNESMRLHFGPRANLYAFLDFGKRAYKHVVTDSAAVKIGGLHYRHIITKIDVYNADLKTLALSYGGSLGSRKPAKTSKKK